MNRIKTLIIAQMVLFLCLLSPAMAAREVASGQPVSASLVTCELSPRFMVKVKTSPNVW